jgi:hypothetical protein
MIAGQRPCPPKRFDHLSYFFPVIPVYPRHSWIGLNQLHSTRSLTSVQSPRLTRVDNSNTSERLYPSSHNTGASIITHYISISQSFRTFLPPFLGPWGYCPSFSKPLSQTTYPHIFPDVSNFFHTSFFSF